MARKMKMRARQTGDITELLVRIQHPMETGLRKDKATRKIIPPHYIQNMTITHNGKKVVSCDIGIAVSKNPVMGFGLTGARTGDKVTLSWKDNMGESGSLSKTLNL
ncbi:MAG: thiosulfate oxidation carrier complex protein SoxZ [Acidiferrobacterales bacterium]